MTPPRPPSCFISYSWDSPAHREWVRMLATRLRAGGVDAVLDAFHAPLGADLTAFMGRIAACDHVLVVCTPGFRAKALRGAGGAGGVGYEQALITGQIFTGAARPEKFIPLLREGAPTEAVPDYLLARHAADFRDDARFEADLEALLRTLHGVPAQPVPALGPVPAFVAASSGASVSGGGTGAVAWQRLLHEPFDLASDDPAASGRYDPTWLVGVDGAWSGVVRDGVCRLDNRRDPDAVTYGHVQLSWGDAQRPLDLNDARASMAVRVLASHGGPFVAAGLLFRFDRVRRHYLGFVLGCDASAGRLLAPQLQLVRRDAAGFASMPLGPLPASAGAAAGASSATRWVTLAVEGQGPRLALSVDGEPFATVEAPPGLAGDPGWLALGAGGFEFDDFVIARRA
jgi:hypothetical protein